MTTDLLDQLIARLPALRDQGVTHVSVDPKTGAVSMLIAPRPPELPDTIEGAQPYNDASTYGRPTGSSMPPSFRERMKTAAGGEG